MTEICATAAGCSPLKLRVITTLSAALEFFDFTLLIFLAPAIATNFFPEVSGVSGIMPVLIIFFAGYLARLLGGLFCGHGGDRLGRKRYFMNTTMLMAVSTLGIALLPGYDSWGFVAPLCLLLLRILQGLSLGGEIPCSIVFGAEFSDRTSRGLATGLIVCGVTLGNVLASCTVSLLFLCFSEKDVYDWAWRIAFIAGSSLGLISFWLRRTLGETPVFEALSEQQKKPWPSLYLCRDQKMKLLRGVCLSGVPAVAVSVLFFMPRFKVHYLNIPSDNAFLLSTCTFLLLALMMLLMAGLSDKVGRIPLMKWGALIMATVVPLSIFFLIGGHLPIFIALLPLLVSGAMIMGVYEVAMVELFSTEARFSGVALCHNLGFCIFGGCTPMLLEWLCSNGLLISFGVWPALVGAALMFFAYSWEDRYQKELDEL